jgi:hypothetical protein
MSLKTEGKFVILTIFSMIFILSLIAIQPSALSTNAKNIHSSEILSTNIFNSIESFLGKIFGISQTTPTFGTPGVSTAASTFSSTFHTTTSTSTVHTTTSTSTVHTTTTTSTVHTTTSTSTLHTTTTTSTVHTTSTSSTSTSTTSTILYETLTITENPINATHTWGACLNYTYHGSNPIQTCVGTSRGFGTTNTISVPYNSTVDYICTTQWSGNTTYVFNEWTGGQYNGYYEPGAPCQSGNIDYVRGPTNFTANFNVETYVNVTLEANPTNALNTWGACFNYTYEGSNPPQTCIGLLNGHNLGNTNSIIVPSGSKISYLCTIQSNSSVIYGFFNWSSNVSGLINPALPACVRSNRNYTIGTLTEQNTTLIIANYRMEPLIIQINPANASNTWGVCLNYTYGGYQYHKLCAGYGNNSSNSRMVPHNSTIVHICASRYGGPSTPYGFVNWSGKAYFTTQCLNGNLENVSRPTNVISNFASINVTLQASPLAAAYDYGVCFNYTYGGLNHPQTCIGPAQGYGISNTIAVPYGSVINYICTANWVNATIPYNFTNWYGIIPVTTPRCTHGNITVIR